MPGANVLDIMTWRAQLKTGAPMNGTTPLQIAAALKRHADSALPQLPALRARSAGATELRQTLNDIEAMSHLANYYGEKILGATELALYDESSQVARRDSAVRHLQTARERSGALLDQQLRVVAERKIGWMYNTFLLTGLRWLDDRRLVASFGDDYDVLVTIRRRGFPILRPRLKLQRLRGRAPAPAGRA